jgi:SAM-dependent methyltransferase
VSGPETLRGAWDANAATWIEWARSPELDPQYWQFNRPRFLELLPPPGRLTVDIACGEGRLTAELAELGHAVVGVEQSPALAAAARERGLEIVEADAVALPLQPRSADLAIAFMSLMNVDDLDAVVREIARVLEPRGRFCFAVPHPFTSAGFLGLAGEPSNDRAPAPYFERRAFVDTRERGGRRMEFHDVHYPLQRYVGAVTDAGLLVEALVEPVPDPAYVELRPSASRWLVEPCYLHVRAVRAESKPGSVPAPSQGKT